MGCHIVGILNSYYAYLSLSQIKLLPMSGSEEELNSGGHPSISQ
jgi:hypothetical protein